MSSGLIVEVVTGAAGWLTPVAVLAITMQVVASIRNGSSHLTYHSQFYGGDRGRLLVFLVMKEPNAGITWDAAGSGLSRLPDLARVGQPGRGHGQP